METIFALATAPGRAGVAIFRVSGDAARRAVLHFCEDLPPPRKAVVRTLRGSDGTVLDHALVLVFEGPRSFTGEDIVEFHIHGGVALCEAMARELNLIPDFRLAEPGEFTKRAMLNGKLDLTDVEGLADLIDAETDAQRRQAQKLLDGALGFQVETWRARMIRAAALIEASIDFADEDVPEDVSDEVKGILEGLISDLQDEIDGSKVAERVRQGFEIAIVGPPNVGKSTLINTISGRDAAITSSIAGTTRDVIEVRMDLDGFAATFLDTAGLRESTDEVERIGIERAKTRATDADLRIFLGDDFESVGVTPTSEDIVLTPKADLVGNPVGAVSGLSGFGVKALLEQVASVLRQRTSSVGVALRARHGQAISTARAHLVEGLKLVSLGEDKYDMAAEELRSGVRELEILVGRIDVENLLDEVFSSFCIGK